MKKIKKTLKQLLNTPNVDGDKYGLIFKTFQDFTMIPREIFISNLKLVQGFSNIDGAIVECGTWKGGMIAGVATLLNDNREYYLFDSFEGLPDVKEIDGDSAKKWQEDKDSEIYFDNCKANEEDAKNAMNISNTNTYKIFKGWFNETLPSANIKGGIAILRLDGDWYESTMDILNNLFENVNKGGLIIIDDYYVWEGCSKAVHDFLSIKKCSENIRSFEGVCYIIKN